MTEQVENTQVVQDLYAAFGRGDMPSILGLLAEDVDWHFVGQLEDIPFAGQWRGHQEMIDFFSIAAQTCEVLAFGPNEVLSYDDHVISFGHERVKVRDTGQVFESDWVHIFKVRSGKVVQLREFYDTEAVAKAFRGS